MELYLDDVWRTLRKWGWILVLLTLVGGGLGYAAMISQDERFTATAQFMVVPPEDEEDNWVELNLSRGYVETYRHLVTSRPVLERVTEQLDIPYDARELSGKVTSIALRDTHLIELQVEDADAEMAAEIATALVEEFNRYVDEAPNDGEALAEAAAPIRVMETAFVPTEPSQPRSSYGVVLGAFLGFVAGTIVLGMLLVGRTRAHVAHKVETPIGGPKRAEAVAHSEEANGGDSFSVSSSRMSTDQ